MLSESEGTVTTAMGGVLKSIETLGSCTHALGALVESCHKSLLGEYEFTPISETATLDKIGSFADIECNITEILRQVQQSIEVMESLASNLN